MAERKTGGGRNYVFPDGEPLQVVTWTEKRAFINFTGASARIPLPTGSTIIELTATENCFINFGDGTVVASTVIADDDSRLFLAGVQVILVPIDPATDEPYLQVAAVQDGTAGTLQIEKANAN